MSNTKTAMNIKEQMAEVNQLTEVPSIKVGTFIVFDTQQVKGLRINIEKIRNYALNQETALQISYDNAGTSELRFPTAELAKAALERLDSYCL